MEETAKGPVMVEYIGPADAVQVFDRGTWVDVIRDPERGNPVVEVSDETANGTAATFAPLPSDAGPDAKPEMLHPGTSGLLAQEDSWRLSKRWPAPPAPPTPQPAAVDSAKEATP